MSSLLNFFPKNSIPRKPQELALARIEKIWDSGKKIAICCLPTGSGKSHIAKTIAYSTNNIPEKLKSHIEEYAIYKKNKDNDFLVENDFLDSPSFGSFILTISKSLQDQYGSLFPNDILIKGKSNYQCDVDDNFAVDFAPCSILPQQKQECFKCNRCPYYKNRNMGLLGKASVLNYSVFLNLPNFLQKRQILVLDEAADLEEELVNKYTLTLNYKNLKSIGIKIKPLTSDKSKSALNWLEDLYNEITKEYEDTVAEAQQISSKSGFSVIGSKLSSDITKLNNLLTTTDLVLENWKTCEYIVEHFSKEKVIFSPYNIKPLAQKMFDKADKILMMSATISNPAEFAKSLGISSENYEYFEIPSSFDAKKSPIICSKKYCLSYKTMDTLLPKIVKAAIEICEQHSDEKGLIHTHTNKITEEFKRQLGENPRFLFRDESNTNEDIIKTHLNSKNPTVLISPSLDTGISLDDDNGRFQIIMKAPYLPLSSNRIKKIFEENPKQYLMKMMDSIIQMCGRCTRSIDDYSVTYILDGTAVNSIQRESNHLPKYFLERFI